VSEFLFSLGWCSAPRHADKTQLILPSKRPDAMFDELERRDYHVVGVNEGWRGVTQEAKDRALWDAWMPFPNHPGPMVGNEFVWQPAEVAAKYPPRKITHTIHDVPGGRKVFSPIVQFRPLGSKTIVPIILCHSVRAKLDPRGNITTQADVLAKAIRLNKRYGRCIALGDLNDGDGWQNFAGAGADTKHAGVTVIAAFGDLRLTDFEVITAGVDGEWTDHPLMGVQVGQRG
jgi:hypothetical protein